MDRSNFADLNDFDWVLQDQPVWPLPPAMGPNHGWASDEDELNCVPDLHRKDQWLLDSSTTLNLASINQNAGYDRGMPFAELSELHSTDQGSQPVHVPDDLKRSWNFTDGISPDLDQNGSGSPKNLNNFVPKLAKQPTLSSSLGAEEGTSADSSSRKAEEASSQGKNKSFSQKTSRASKHSRRGKRRMKDIKSLNSKFEAMESIQDELVLARGTEEPKLSFKQRAALRNRMTSHRARLKKKILSLSFMRQTSKKDEKMKLMMSTLEEVLSSAELDGMLAEAEQSWRAIDAMQEQIYPLQVGSQGLYWNHVMRLPLMSAQPEDEATIIGEFPGELSPSEESIAAQLVRSHFKTPTAVMEYCQPNQEAE